MDVAGHPSSGFVNRYTAPESPALSSSPGAPTTTLLPSALTDTSRPNSSSASPATAVSLVDVAFHGLVNTYAEPASSSLPSPRRAPTATVLPSPLTDTDQPNTSSAAPSGAVSLSDMADVVHPPDGRVNI